eukprot:Tbor_TRINITY_DN5807_c3_g5::TRINITY_DN5807_c3_g5_i1::g.5982::m.5982
MSKPLVGKVVSLTYTDAPVLLYPPNNQNQLSSLTIALQLGETKKKRKGGVVPPMSHVKIDIKAIIGNGTFGIVYRASCHPFPNFALKVCVGKSERLRQECGVMSRVACKKYPLVAELFFSAWSEDNPCLLILGMELCVPLTLHDFILEQEINEACAKHLAWQVVTAIMSVHKEKCVHRDVKLQNFVFSLDGNLKLVDFGVAYENLTPPAGDVRAGTIAYMAPEMAYNVLAPKDKRVSVGAPADIWSVGAVLFCIFTLDNMYPSDLSSTPTTPSNDNAARELLNRVQQGQWKWPPDKMCSVPVGFKALIERMMQVDAERRPTLEAVLEDPCWGKAHKKRGIPPQEIIDFLQVCALDRDHDGHIKVEGASNKKSPLRGFGAHAATTPTKVNINNNGYSPQGSTVKREVLMNRSGTLDTTAHQLPARGPSATRRILDDEIDLLSPYVSKTAEKIMNSRQKESIPLQLRHEQISLNIGLKITSEEEKVRDKLVIMEQEHFTVLNQLLNAQFSNFSHPHRFKYYTKPVNASYAEGAVCDECGTWVQRRRDILKLYHCSCGSDLCIGCYQAYEKRNTCCAGCLVVTHNPQEYRKHISKCKYYILEEQRKAFGIVSRDIPKARGYTNRSRSREMTVAPLTESTTIREIKGAASQSKSRGRKSASMRKTLQTKPLSRPGEEEPIESVELNQVANPWAEFKPFDHLNTMIPTIVEPSPSEKEALVNSDWVRYFHYYEGDTQAFVYCIQKGRTGALFLSNTSAVHSAISAVINSQLFIVDFVDISDVRNDRVRVLSINEGKQQHWIVVKTLLDVVQSDSNLIKQKRSVGVMSLCQKNQSAVLGSGEPYIYVRWMRTDSANNLTAFCLSNGHVQIFVGQEYEVRWTGESRKFLLRANGTFEHLSDEAFGDMPALVELLSTS